MINKLLVINTGVYLILLLARMIFGLFGIENLLTSMLGIPASAENLIKHIWTPITYMFVHMDFMHILANMLWLYFMGRLFQYTFNNKQTLAVYILGGLSGALLYFLFFNLIPTLHPYRDFSFCIGASAAVTALVISCCVNNPNMEIRIFGVIPMTLKWLGIIYVALDVIQVFSSSNAGGHVTHIGGAIYGLLFATMIRRGKDITRGFNNMIDKIVSLMPSGSKTRKSNMHVSYKNTSNARTAQEMTDAEFNQQKAADQQRIDEILDKISKSGYNNLSKEEKEFLFKMSKK